MLVGIYIVAIAVLMYLRTAPFIGSETDGVYYMMAARNLFTKAFVPSTFGGGVGMPLAIATMNAIVPDTFRSAQLVSAIAGLVYLVASVRILSKLFTSAVAIATGALLFVSPIFLFYSTTSLTDVLGASLPLAGLWLLLSETKLPRWLSLFLAALLFGAAYTVRPINFVFFPLPLVAAARRLDRNSMRFVAAAVLGLLVGTLPQLYVNQKFFGNPFHSDNWRNTAALVFDWNYVNRLTSFREAVQQAGPRLFTMWLRQLLFDVPVALYHVAYLPVLFALPGLLVLAKSKGQRVKTGLDHRMTLTWIACSVGYLVLVASVWRIEPRYFLPILPLLLVAGLTMWQLLTQQSQLLFVAGVAVALLMSATVTLRNGRELLRSQSTEFKEAGLFLRDKAADGDLIVASQPSVFFYAQRPGVLLESLPNENLQRFNETTNAQQFDWVVFDERRAHHDNPALDWMLDPESTVARGRGWQPLFVRESPRIVVWRTPRQYSAAIQK